MTELQHQKQLARARKWKAAHKGYLKAARAEYYRKNKERELAMAASWRKENPELYRVVKRRSDALWRANNADYIKQWKRSYRITHNEKERLKYKTDVSYNLQKRLRASMHQSVKRLGISKSHHFIKLLGCTVEVLKAHIKNNFKDGMTWDNRSEWHIDHIKPCAAFDLTDEKQQFECFHYSNLQPLWASENRKKNATWIEPHERNEDSIDM